MHPLSRVHYVAFAICLSIQIVASRTSPASTTSTSTTETPEADCFEFFLGVPYQHRCFKAQAVDSKYKDARHSVAPTTGPGPEMCWTMLRPALMRACERCSSTNRPSGRRGCFVDDVAAASRQTKPTTSKDQTVCRTVTVVADVLDESLCSDPPATAPSEKLQDAKVCLKSAVLRKQSFICLCKDNLGAMSQRPGSCSAYGSKLAQPSTQEHWSIFNVLPRPMTLTNGDRKHPTEQPSKPLPTSTAAAAAANKAGQAATATTTTPPSARNIVHPGAKTAQQQTVGQQQQQQVVYGEDIEDDFLDELMPLDDFSEFDILDPLSEQQDPDTPLQARAQAEHHQHDHDDDHHHHDHDNHHHHDGDKHHHHDHEKPHHHHDGDHHHHHSDDKTKKSTASTPAAMATPASTSASHAVKVVPATTSAARVARALLRDTATSNPYPANSLSMGSDDEHPTNMGHNGHHWAHSVNRLKYAAQNLPGRHTGAAGWDPREQASTASYALPHPSDLKNLVNRRTAAAGEDRAVDPSQLPAASNFNDLLQQATRGSLPLGEGPHKAVHRPLKFSKLMLEHEEDERIAVA